MKIKNTKVLFLLSTFTLSLTSVLSVTSATNYIKQQLSNPPINMEENEFENQKLKNSLENPNLLALDTGRFTSNYNNNNELKNITDNNFFSSWSSGTSIAKNKSINIEKIFNKTREISAFSLNFLTNNVKNFEVRYKTSKDSNWKVLTSWTKKDQDKNVMDFFVNLREPKLAYGISLLIKDWEEPELNKKNEVIISEFQALSRRAVPNPNINLIVNPKITSSVTNDAETNNKKLVDGNPLNAWVIKNPTEEDSSGNSTNWFKIEFSKPKPANVLKFSNVSFKKIKVKLYGLGDALIDTKSFENNENKKDISYLLENKTNDFAAIEVRIDKPEGEISIGNLEVYENFLEEPKSAKTVFDELSLKNLTIKTEGDVNKLDLLLPEGYKFEIFKASGDHILDKNLIIKKPLWDSEIKFKIKIFNEANPNDFYVSKTIKYLVPALKRPNKGATSVANVFPGFAEWFSYKDEEKSSKTIWFDSNENSKIYVILGNKNKIEITELINMFKNDFNLNNKHKVSDPIFINSLSEVPDDKGGNFVFDLSDNAAINLEKDSYHAKIEKNFVINAIDKIGLFYATRTLRHTLLKDSDSFSVHMGEIKDYPKYKNRSINLDVANKPFSVKLLKEFIKTISNYKINELELTLSGNYKFLENYVSDMAPKINEFDAYSAFRLESNIEKDGVKLTSKDLNYSKAQFKEIMDFAKIYNVKIVPKFVFPGSSLQITKVFKNLAKTGFYTTADNRPLSASLDLSKPETFETIKKILDEYTNKNGIFSKETETTISIDATGFTDDFENAETRKNYSNFIKQLTEYFKNKDIKLRLKLEKSLIENEADFDIANDIFKNVEIVGMTNFANVIDEWDNTTVFFGETNKENTAEENKIMTTILETWNHDDYFGETKSKLSDKSVVSNFVGTSLKLDFSEQDNNKNNFTALNYLGRLNKLLFYYATHAWKNNNLDTEEFEENLGREFITDDFYVKQEKINIKEKDRSKYYFFDFDGKNFKEKLFDKRGNKGFLSNLTNVELSSESSLNETTNETIKNNFLKLNGGNSFVDLPNSGSPYKGILSFKIKRMKSEDAKSEEIIFSNKENPENFSIKANQKGTGKFGFSGDGVDYVIDYMLPLNEWATIEFRSVYNFVSKKSGFRILVNGEDKTETLQILTQPKPKIELTSDLTKPEAPIHIAKLNFVLPLERIGSEKNSFKGYITNISNEFLSAYTDDLGGYNNSEKIKKWEDNPLTIEVEGVLNANELTKEKIKISGYDEKTEKVIFDIVKFDNDNQNVILRVNITQQEGGASSTVRYNDDLTFTREYYISLKTPLSKLIDEINAFDKNISKHTKESVDDYDVKINKFLKDNENLTSLTESKLEELKNEFKKITTILETYKTNILKLANQELLETSKENYSKKYTASSINNHKNTLGEITTNVHKLSDIDYNKYQEFYQQLNQSKQSLVLENPMQADEGDTSNETDVVLTADQYKAKLKDLVNEAKSTNYDKTKYNNEKLENFNNVIKKIELKIKDSEPIDKTSFENLSNELIKSQKELNESSISGVNYGAIFGGLFAALSIAGAAASLFYFKKKKMLFWKEKPKQ